MENEKYIDNEDEEEINMNNNNMNDLEQNYIYNGDKMEKGDENE